MRNKTKSFLEELIKENSNNISKFKNSLININRNYNKQILNKQLTKKSIF